MANNLVGPKEMANILGVPLSWIYQRTSIGQNAIPFVKVGKYIRFSPEEVVDFLKAKTN